MGYHVFCCNGTEIFAREGAIGRLSIDTTFKVAGRCRVSVPVGPRIKEIQPRQIELHIANKVRVKGSCFPSKEQIKGIYLSPGFGRRKGEKLSFDFLGSCEIEVMIPALERTDYDWDVKQKLPDPQRILIQCENQLFGTSEQFLWFESKTVLKKEYDSKYIEEYEIKWIRKDKQRKNELSVLPCKITAMAATVLGPNVRASGAQEIGELMTK